MDCTLYIGGTTPAVRFAADALRSQGFSLSARPEDAAFTLLDVPSLDAQGRLKNGYFPEEFVKMLPDSCRIIGGNLNHPAFSEHPHWDLLKDEPYLRQNALITAHCALIIAGEELPVILPQAPTLVIGWGRIGKALAKLLHIQGVPVTVTARSLGDRALLTALGYDAALLEETDLEEYRLIINTVPAPVLTRDELQLKQHPVKLDLASTKGLEGEDVIHARGLPGLRAPESSGRLIAKTILELLREEEL